MDEIALFISVCVDYWTAESAIIASNEPGRALVIWGSHSWACKSLWNGVKTHT